MIMLMITIVPMRHRIRDRISRQLWGYVETPTFWGVSTELSPVTRAVRRAVEIKHHEGWRYPT